MSVLIVFLFSSIFSIILLSCVRYHFCTAFYYCLCVHRVAPLLWMKHCFRLIELTLNECKCPTSTITHYIDYCFFFFFSSSSSSSRRDNYTISIQKTNCYFILFSRFKIGLKLIDRSKNDSMRFVWCVFVLHMCCVCSEWLCFSFTIPLLWMRLLLTLWTIRKVRIHTQTHIYVIYDWFIWAICNTDRKCVMCRTSIFYSIISLNSQPHIANVLSKSCV